jgi:hypothetical protein
MGMLRTNLSFFVLLPKLFEDKRATAVGAVYSESTAFSHLFLLLSKLVNPGI